MATSSKDKYDTEPVSSRAELQANPLELEKSESYSSSSDEEHEAASNCDIREVPTRKSRPHPFRNPSDKKPKLRTSKDVYDRLKWDSASIKIESNVQVDLLSVYIGYKDRFLGMCELPYHDFCPGEDIPFHRIYYFRNGGAPVEPFIGENGEMKVREDNWPQDSFLLWDRETRTDLIFKSGNFH